MEDFKMENLHQIKNYLAEASRRANDFADQNNVELMEYWKGQVLGMIKIINLLELDINTEFYIKQIP